MAKALLSFYLHLIMLANSEPLKQVKHSTWHTEPPKPCWQSCLQKVVTLTTNYKSSLPPITYHLLYITQHQTGWPETEYTSSHTDKRGYLHNCVPALIEIHWTTITRMTLQSCCKSQCTERELELAMIVWSEAIQQFRVNMTYGCHVLHVDLSKWIGWIIKWSTYPMTGPYSIKLSRHVPYSKWCH